MRPDSEADLSAMLRAAPGPVAITGGASRLYPGEGQGARIDMRGLTGITLYEPAALTLVVRAGTPFGIKNGAFGECHGGSAVHEAPLGCEWAARRLHEAGLHLDGYHAHVLLHAARRHRHGDVQQRLAGSAMHHGQ